MGAQEPTPAAPDWQTVPPAGAVDEFVRAATDASPRHALLALITLADGSHEASNAGALGDTGALRAGMWELCHTLGQRFDRAVK